MSKLIGWRCVEKHLALLVLRSVHGRCTKNQNRLAAKLVRMQTLQARIEAKQRQLINQERWVTERIALMKTS